MCGITGIYSFNDMNRDKNQHLVQKAVKKICKRGPDSTGFYANSHIVLGHARLAVIDVSTAASQPFTDASGRYTIVYNGEIYNFLQIRNDLEKEGFNFISKSDTEALLYLYISKKEKCLEELNGFFAFAIYDNHDKSLFLARDRYGIKPLFFYHDNERFIFGSEMKAVMQYDILKSIDRSSLFTYFQLNYIPGPWTILENVKKLSPGHYIKINSDTKVVAEKKYYSIPFASTTTPTSYDKSCKKLYELLERSVTDRLVSDVPLGTFLSGGIDSSIISALAARHVKNLNTFSIGFRDEPMFDETHYANIVAKMHNTNHTVFNITNDDLLSCLFETVDYFDEPFADSSALAVYILSRQTKQKVTVALSGDGADELFAGYNKHMAEYRALNPSYKEKIARVSHPLLSKMPQSRNNILSNKTRQIVRFGEGMKMKPADRYWHWCSLASEINALNLLKDTVIPGDYITRKNSLTNIFRSKSVSVNNTLFADMQMVLPYDMLTKVDLMSMANSLEVRTPFLAHNLVDFAFTLPEHYKIDKNNRKTILKDTFKHLLPKEIISRPKHGFEVPLLKWFRNELNDFINNDVMEDSFIKEQNIFNPGEIKVLKQKLHSPNPGDTPARIWAVIVFQQWWKNYYNS